MDSNEVRSKERSPNYPRITLKDAISKAETIWKKERKSSVHTEVLFKHLGYSAKSGSGRRVFSALKEYGLIASLGTGSKQAKLTDLALDIILVDDNDLSTRNKAIRKAALLPNIHRRIWEKFGESLPSDANFQRMLMTDEWKFTARGARNFAMQFRNTVEFAGLEKFRYDTGYSDDKRKDSEKESNYVPEGDPFDETLRKEQSSHTEAEKMRAVQIPLADGKWAILQACFPLSKPDWELMKGILEAMKPGLVETNDTD